MEVVKDRLFVVEGWDRPQLLIIDSSKNHILRQWDLPINETYWYFKVDHDRIYLTSDNQQQIYVYSLTGKEITRFGQSEASQKAEEFNYPRGVTVDEKYLYLCDYFNHRIQVLDKTNGHFIRQWGRYGDKSGELYCPEYLCLDGELLYVSDRFRVQVFSKTGDFIHYLGSGVRGSSEGEFMSPASICVVGERVYVADWGNKRIQVFWK